MALNDPMGDILQNVMGVASYIQNAKIQREAMLRQRETDAHNEAVRKVEFLNSGDPVGVDGTISRMVQAPDTSTFTMGPDGMPRATGGMNPLATRLPVDPARTVAYKGSTVYVPTQREHADQQLQTVLDRTRAVEGIQTAGAVDRFRQEQALKEEQRARTLANEGIDLPIPGQGTRRFLPENVDNAARVITALTPKESESEKNRKLADEYSKPLLAQVDLLGLKGSEALPLKAAINAHLTAGDVKGASAVIDNYLKDKGADARHRETLSVTVRGQNMTDQRQRELNDINRENKPASAAEKSALSFYTQAHQAEEILSKLGPEMAKKGLVDQARYKFAPDALLPENDKMYRQAQRQFTEARLRKVSGAAISNAEYEKDAKTYFPQPGDGPNVLNQKAKARESILKSLRVESGRALKEFDPTQQKPVEPTVDAGNGVPAVGATFNGQKVLKVTKVQ